MNTRLRCALVGLGQQATRFATDAASAHRAVICAAASADRERAAKFAARFNLPLSGTYDEILARPDIDAIIIASPNDRHAPDALRAFAAGKHVLVEKPMALTTADGETMINTARAAKRSLVVGFHLRHRPAIVCARALIVGGAIGILRFIEAQWATGMPGGSLPELPVHEQWREDLSRSGGGAIMARGVHLIDMVRFLTGDEITALTGMTNALLGGVDQNAAAIVRLGTADAVIMTSRLLPFPLNEVRVFGTAGMIRITGALTSAREEAVERITADGKKIQTFSATARYADELDEFAAYVAGEPTTIATGADGLMAIRAVNAWQRSRPLSL